MSEPVKTDQDIMPFGLHKGKKMVNVPADYLLWIHDNLDESPVHSYIHNNMAALITEKDLGTEAGP